MKQMKYLAALCAAVTAVLPVSTAALSNASVAYAEEVGTVGEQTQQFPTDFESALEFRNTYGATRILDDTVCVVFREEVDFGNGEDLVHEPRYEIITTKGVMAQTYTKSVGSEEDHQCPYYYTVYVFHAVEPGEFKITLKDNGEEAAAYTFTVDEEKHIRETDICGWLPDCETEYKYFAAKNGKVSVHENKVLMCLDYSIGTAYSWQEKLEDENGVFEHSASQYCSIETAAPLAGGSGQRIEVYTAVKDGDAKINWDYGSFALNTPKISETLTADCVVLDNAQTILLADTARITFTDFETGKLLDFPSEAQTVKVCPNIAFRDKEDLTYKFVDLMLMVNSNPYYWDIAEFKKADVFQMPLAQQDLPSGYTLPEDYATIVYYDNGAKDINFRLKKASAEPKKGTTTITLLDRDTGELIPEDLVKAHPFTFGIDYKIQQDPAEPFKYANVPSGYTVIKNPYVIQYGLAELYQTADSFTFRCDDQPEVTVHDDGSMDIVFKTKLKVSGDANGDGLFTIADVVMLTKWLVGDPGAELYCWTDVDFCMDNKLNAADLSAMKKALLAAIKPVEQQPVSVQITKTGGIFGVHEDWNVSLKEGKYLLSSENTKLPSETGTVEITESEYRQVMAVDYDGIIRGYEEYPPTPVIDGFYYTTVLTYADGSVVTTKADMASVIALMSRLLTKHSTQPAS